MRRVRSLIPLAIALAVTLALAACGKPPGPPFDAARLESALDPSVGGPDTCLLILDSKTGAEVYRYGAPSVCDRPLAPCNTFAIPMALIGLDDGKLKPDETWTWDGKPQPYKLWERDADLAGAWRTGSGWFFQRLAGLIGTDRFKQRLSAFGYGQGAPIGDPLSFWQGPAAGGGLFISTRGQAEFLRKLARGDLPVRPASTSAVLALMADQTRGRTVLADIGASCSSNASDSRGVSWWIGRIAGPDRDRVFALSIESDKPLPGFEIRTRVIPIFTRAGLLPPEDQPPKS
jgi:beta-lactamase class D